MSDITHIWWSLIQQTVPSPVYSRWFKLLQKADIQGLACFQWVSCTLPHFPWCHSAQRHCCQGILELPQNPSILRKGLGTVSFQSMPCTLTYCLIIAYLVLSLSVCKVFPLFQVTLNMKEQIKITFDSWKILPNTSTSTSLSFWHFASK